MATLHVNTKLPHPSHRYADGTPLWIIPGHDGRQRTISVLDGQVYDNGIPQTPREIKQTITALAAALHHTGKDTQK